MHRRERALSLLACRELVLVILLKSARIPLAAQWGVADRQAVAGQVVTRPAHLGRATSEYGLCQRRSEIQNDSVSTWLADDQRPILCRGRCSWGFGLHFFREKLRRLCPERGIGQDRPALKMF